MISLLISLHPPHDAEGELTTPTGAAIAAALVDDYGPLPAMTINAIGYGAGQKDFDHPNLLRLVIGEGDDAGNVGTLYGKGGGIPTDLFGISSAFSSFITTSFPLTFVIL